MSTGFVPSDEFPRNAPYEFLRNAPDEYFEKLSREKETNPAAWEAFGRLFTSQTRIYVPKGEKTRWAKPTRVPKRYIGVLVDADEDVIVVDDEEYDKYFWCNSDDDDDSDDDGREKPKKSVIAAEEDPLLDSTKTQKGISIESATTEEAGFDSKKSVIAAEEDPLPDSTKSQKGISRESATTEEAGFDSKKRKIMEVKEEGKFIIDTEELLDVFLYDTENHEIFTAQMLSRSISMLSA